MLIENLALWQIIFFFRNALLVCQVFPFHLPKIQFNNDFWLFMFIISRPDSIFIFCYVRVERMSILLVFQTPKLKQDPSPPKPRSWHGIWKQHLCSTFWFETRDLLFPDVRALLPTICHPTFPHGISVCMCDSYQPTNSLRTRNVSYLSLYSIVHHVKEVLKNIC